MEYRSDDMHFEISKVADAVVMQTSLFQCSIDEAWDRYTHDLIKNQFTLEEVKAYINRKVQLGESLTSRE